MNLEELLDENRALRERVATLEAHIHGGIHCAFFCALPECFKNLAGEDHDQNFTDAPRSQTVGKPDGAPAHRPPQSAAVAALGAPPWGPLAAPHEDGKDQAMSCELFEALASASAPPCTGYACPCQRDCSTQKLACESFVHYVNSGRSVHPLMLFKKNNNGWRALNMLKHEHAPTRALYDRVFKEEA